MKRNTLTIVLALVLATTAFALYDTGWGKVVTASTTCQRVTGFTGNTVSLSNVGAVRVFTLANTTTNVLATRIAAGTAIPIPAGGTFTFDGNGQAHVESVCLATSNGTATVLIGSF